MLVRLIVAQPFAILNHTVMRNNIRGWVLFLLPIIFAILLSYVLQGLIIKNQEQFTAWLSSFGPYVILVYAILQATTVIVAPLGGFFLLVAMVALFGPGVALFWAYIVTAPCYLINFYLSKRYGRPMAERIVGKGSLSRMDRFVENAGLGILIILRLFQSSNFDYLSYAFGLTNISFKKFAVVNFLVGIPAAVIAYFMFSLSGSLTRGVAVHYIVGAVFTGLSVLLALFLQKRKPKLK